MPEKRKRSAASMAGEQDEDFELRLPGKLKKRLQAAVKKPMTTTMSAAVRDLMVEPYCAFVEAHNHQPRSFEELAAWYLERETLP